MKRYVILGCILVFAHMALAVDNSDFEGKLGPSEIEDLRTKFTPLYDFVEKNQKDFLISPIDLSGLSEDELVEEFRKRVKHKSLANRIIKKNAYNEQTGSLDRGKLSQLVASHFVDQDTFDNFYEIKELLEKNEIDQKQLLTIEMYFTDLVSALRGYDAARSQSVKKFLKNNFDPFKKRVREYREKLKRIAAGEETPLVGEDEISREPASAVVASEKKEHGIRIIEDYDPLLLEGELAGMSEKERAGWRLPKKYEDQQAVVIRRTIEGDLEGLIIDEYEGESEEEEKAQREELPLFTQEELHDIGQWH